MLSRSSSSVMFLRMQPTAREDGNDRGSRTEYAELLSMRRPHAIRTRRAYEAAMREIEQLTARARLRSAAETEYYRVLCVLVADYERCLGADRWPRLLSQSKHCASLWSSKASRRHESPRHSAIVRRRRLS